MRTIATYVWVPAILLGACSAEYEIGQPPIAFGEPNPPALENPVNEDRIVQVTTPAVDVLWVVDNSGSMSDNQTALAENFPAFMDYFLGSGLDYHIGVVSTDMDDSRHEGKLRQAAGTKFITTETPDAMAVFSTMAQIGSSGSSMERGREAAYAAFELERDFNEGFLRFDDESAGAHIIAISDEDDKSRKNVITVDEYIAYLNDLRPEDDLVTFNSICNPPPGGLINEAGVDYISVTEGVGGLMRDIKSEDWSEMLEALGIQAAGLKTEYFLSSIPVIDTIEVRVEDDGQVFPFERGADFEYDKERNSIRFLAYVPNPLAEVFIDYTVLASVVD